MIDDRREEQAALHLLGALSEREAAEFKQALNSDPELKAYVARLSVAPLALAGDVPVVEPPPQLRARILAQVAPQPKMVSLTERSYRPGFWLGWALAGGFALLCGVFFYGYAKANANLSSRNIELVDLNRTVQSLESATNVLGATIGEQARQIGELNQLAQSLESATNDLRQTVVALQETNRLVNLKIAMLNSLLADAPKTVAVTLWDDAKQDGVFVVQNLKPLPEGRDYQLWVLDQGKTPVDAGLIHVDKNGGGRVEFKARQPVKVAGMFAVTEEAAGGVPSPTLKNMVLASSLSL